MATTVDLGKVRPVWKGAWSASTAYEVHDMVKEGVNSYICTTGHTSSSAFSSDSANWDNLAQGVDIPTQSGNSGNFLQTDGSSLSWASASAGLKSQQVFTTAGSHTWTKPSGINLVKVIVTGAGGGGGGGSSNDDIGAGGGAGGTAIKIIDVSSVSSVSVTVGAGGSGASNDTSGSAGGSSSFGSYATGNGGGGGTFGNAGPVTGGAGGGTSGGDIGIVGGDGHSGQDNIYSSSYESSFGHGGSSFWGGGGRGATQNVNARDGQAYGSGGGGDNSIASGNGGTGKSGIVVVEEYA